MARRTSTLEGIVRVRRRASPSATLGTHGEAIFGGYIVENERNPKLTSKDARYRTYADLLANTSIIGASVRYFLNLIGNATWTFSPAPGDIGKEYAERAERIFMEEPVTPWQRIIRRCAMYRFYGFSIQEWTSKRLADGWFGFHDIEPRAQLSIERWDVEPTGNVLGCTQVSPQTQEEIYLPRWKMLYVVDDSLNDSPEGFGLFRHLVASATRLKFYEQLEGDGFQTDLRGIPVGYAPIAALKRLVVAGEMTQEQYDQALNAMRMFIKDHRRRPDLGMMLDSAPYQTSDDAQRPSNARQWQIELLRGSSTSHREIAQAIERLNRECGRILGTDQLLLGSTDSGSYALSRDKTTAFYMMANSTLNEIRETIQRQLLVAIWNLNGWPDAMMPKIQTSAIRFADPETMGRVLKDLATAGAPTLPNDPAVPALRSIIDLPPPDEDEMDRLVADALMAHRMQQNNGGGGENGGGENTGGATEAA